MMRDARDPCRALAQALAQALLQPQYSTHTRPAGLQTVGGSFWLNLLLTILGWLPGGWAGLLCMHRPRRPPLQAPPPPPP